MLLIIRLICGTRVFQIAKLKISLVKVALFKNFRAVFYLRRLSKLFFFYPPKVSASIPLPHF